jgi:hypothetical protein
MSALAGNRWEIGREAIGTPAPLSRDSKQTSPMRDRMCALRDTLLVLGLQLVFRVTLIMRRWNY